MASGREQEARSSRHRRDMEDRRELVTSTPAVTTHDTRHNVPSERLLYDESTDGYETDESEYSDETEVDDREVNRNHFQGFPQLEQPQIRDRQIVQTRENSQADNNQDHSDYEWEELQTSQYTGEDEHTIRQWEKLINESRDTRAYVKRTIIRYLTDFRDFIKEEVRHPDEIDLEKRRIKNKLYDLEGEVIWLRNRAKEFVNEYTELPFNWLLNRIDDTQNMLEVARYDMDTAAIAGTVNKDITLSKYEITKNPEPIKPKNYTKEDIQKAEEIQRKLEEAYKRQRDKFEAPTILTPRKPKMLKPETVVPQENNNIPEEREDRDRNAIPTVDPTLGDGKPRKRESRHKDRTKSKTKKKKSKQEKYESETEDDDRHQPKSYWKDEYHNVKTPGFREKEKAREKDRYRPQSPEREESPGRKRYTQRERTPQRPRSPPRYRHSRSPENPPRYKTHQRPESPPRYRSHRRQKSPYRHRSPRRSQSPLRHRSPQGSQSPVEHRSHRRQKSPYRHRSHQRSQSPYRQRSSRRSRSPQRSRSPYRHHSKKRQASPGRKDDYKRKPSPDEQQRSRRQRSPPREKSPQRERSPYDQRSPVRKESPRRKYKHKKQNSPIRKRSPVRDNSPDRQYSPIRQYGHQRHRSPQKYSNNQRKAEVEREPTEREKKLEAETISLKASVESMQQIVQTLLAAVAGGNTGKKPRSESEERLPKLKDIVTPTFTGDRASYKAYKEGIIAYLDSLKIREKYRGHYIYESLRGDAKKHIGENESWLGREEDLWTRLDTKYGCRWTMMAELVKLTICAEAPTTCGQELDEYLENMCNQIRKVRSSNMPSDQMAMQKVLLDIPTEKANQLRNALRVHKGLQNSHTTDITFSLEDFEQVIQESITNCITKSSTPKDNKKTIPKPAEVSSIINMQTVADNNKSNTSNNTNVSANNTNISNNNGYKDPYNKYDNNNNQRNSGYNPGYYNKNKNGYDNSRNNYNDQRKGYDNNRSYDNKGGYNNNRSNDNNRYNDSGRGSYNSNRYNSEGNGYSNNNWKTDNQRFPYRTRQCKLCSSPDHWAGICDQFKTSEQKCAKLREQGNCDKCNWREEQGHECRLRYNCRRCNDGIHLEWLCRNQQSQQDNTR